MAASGSDDDSLVVVWHLLERTNPAAAQRGGAPNGAAAAGDDADVDGARLPCLLSLPGARPVVGKPPSAKWVICQRKLLFAPFPLLPLQMEPTDGWPWNH